NTTLGLFVVIMLLNGISVLVNSFSYKLNKRYYWEAKSRKKGIRTYSLGERYQIAENIQTCRVNSFSYKLNKRYYWEAKSRKKGIRTYSLGERYQIAENIQTCRFVNGVVLSVGILNMIASVSLILDNFVQSMFYRNMAVLTFNYSTVVYGFVIPVVIYSYNDSWKFELNRLRRKVFDSRKTVPVHMSIKSTLGKETHVEQARHGDHYFTMLQKDLR
ncbi:hypothetical protein TELCIR_15440, partial [Teladorsagia circumcincta]